MPDQEPRLAKDIRNQFTRPLIQQDFTYVMVSHKELDGLIASLMHLAELDSDKEHREALKAELKQRSRSWLDNIYRDSGYENYDYVPGAWIVDVYAITTTNPGLIIRKKENQAGHNPQDVQAEQ